MEPRHPSQLYEAFLEGALLFAILWVIRIKLPQLKHGMITGMFFILYALFPVTGKKYLLQKYGKEEVPESLKPITLKDVEKQAEMIKKAKAGELIEKSAAGNIPEKSEYARVFNVFVEFLVGNLLREITVPFQKYLFDLLLHETKSIWYGRC